jgi:hypothetical protein
MKHRAQFILCYSFLISVNTTVNNLQFSLFELQVHVITLAVQSIETCELSRCRVKYFVTLLH